ncbi:MAG: 2OG-Fe(II) oxygenase, partial [Pseudomonadota bacterium]
SSPKNRSGGLRNQASPPSALVLFESERFVHEVLPAFDNRYSIAGWFRKNASISGIIDPPR